MPATNVQPIRVRLQQSQLLPDNDPLLSSGQRLYTTHRQSLGLKITTKECRVEKPNGDLLFRLVKDVIPEKVWRPAYDLLRTVSGSLSNRPDVIGANLRMPQIKKNGTLGSWTAASPELVDEFGGNADLLGYFRYKNPAPGVADCAPTAWTQGSPQILTGCIDFIRAVDEVYRLMLPDEYKKQRAIAEQGPASLRMFDTAFTTLYVLKNAPTAVHKDKADAKGTFGCMASLGDWSGNELVFPKYRVGADYRPGDVILADVHEWHSNLPLLPVPGDDRVSCVFFVRSGMDACPK